LSLSNNLPNLNLREILTMSVHTAVTLAAAHLEDADLGILTMIEDGRLDGCSCDERLPHRRGVAIHDQEDFVEGDRSPLLTLEQWNVDLVSRRDLLLKTGDIDDSKHKRAESDRGSVGNEVWWGKRKIGIRDL